MRSTTALAVAAAVLAAAALPRSAAADVTIGANLGSARTNGGDFDGSDTGYKLYIGSAFSQFIGGEIGYVNFGNLGGDGPEARAWTPAVTIGVPLGLARVFGKAGVAFADVEGSTLRDEYQNEDPFWGLGVRFGVAPGLGFRAEYERYTVGNDNLDMAEAGIELRF
jgi:opacity protein-like surface antigen